MTPKPSPKNPSKIPPYSKDAEMVVLGCMLTSSDALTTASDLLASSDFYMKEHQILFDLFKEAQKKDKPCDLLLVSEELKRLGKLDEIGGITYLTMLIQHAGTAAHIQEYAQIVKNKSLLRQLKQASLHIEELALSEPDDVLSTLDEAQATLFKIGQNSHCRHGLLVKDLLLGTKGPSSTPYLKMLEERQEEFLNRDPNSPPVTGIPSHFTDLDKLINGFCPSQLIILAARPSMGKTALALNIAENILLKSHKSVAIFSLEMNAEELLHRMICSQSEVESEKIRTGALTGQEYQRIVESVHRLQKHTLIIDDEPGIRISDLRARARRMKELYGIELIIIDYLQLLSGSRQNYNPDQRQNEISEISRNLKTLARELNVPIICLSQLSRKVEERQGHRPMLSDLRESGSIEQDADIVMLIFRRDYYNPHDKPGLVELIVAKNRHGSVGDVTMTYRKQIAQFNNHTQEKEPEKNDSAFAAFSPRR